MIIPALSLIDGTQMVRLIQRSVIHAITVAASSCFILPGILNTCNVILLGVLHNVAVIRLTRAKIRRISNVKSTDSLTESAGVNESWLQLVGTHQRAYFP